MRVDSYPKVGDERAVNPHLTWVQTASKVEYWELHFLGVYICSVWRDLDGGYHSTFDMDNHQIEYVHDSLREATEHAEQVAATTYGSTLQP